MNKSINRKVVVLVRSTGISSCVIHLHNQKGSPVFCQVSTPQARQRPEPAVWPLACRWRQRSKSTAFVGLRCEQVPLVPVIGVSPVPHVSTSKHMCPSQTPSFPSSSILGPRTGGAGPCAPGPHSLGGKRHKHTLLGFVHFVSGVVPPPCDSDTAVSPLIPPSSPSTRGIPSPGSGHSR